MTKIDIDPTNTLIGVFGGHNCGKSYFMKTMTSKYRTVVFDPLREYNPEKFDVYRPESDRQDRMTKEYNQFLRDLRDTQRVKETPKYELLISSEISSYLRNGSYGTHINNFLNYYRHPIDERGWDIGGLYDARRPAKVHADLREVTPYKIIFGGISGSNDLRALDNMATGLSDAVRKLDTPFDRDKGPGHFPYEFIVVYPDNNFEVCAPI